MPITRARKEEVVALLTERFERCQSAVLVDYRGLSVADMQTVRRELREAGSDFMVAKNTLLRLALGNVGRSLQGDGYDLSHLLEGLTAIAFGYDDPRAPAEVLMRLSTQFESMTLKGGFFGDLPVEGKAGVDRIAKMRSKEDALADIIRIIHPAAGLRQLVTVAKGGPTRMVVLGGNAVRTVKSLQTLKQLDSEAA